MQTILDPKNLTLEFLAGYIFMCCNYNQSTLFTTEESFMVELLNFLKKIEIQESLQKVIKTTEKSRIASINFF